MNLNHIFFSCPFCCCGVEGEGGSSPKICCLYGQMEDHMQWYGYLMICAWALLKNLIFVYQPLVIWLNLYSFNIFLPFIISCCYLYQFWFFQLGVLGRVLLSHWDNVTIYDRVRNHLKCKQRICNRKLRLVML